MHIIALEFNHNSETDDIQMGYALSVHLLQVSPLHLNGART